MSANVRMGYFVGDVVGSFMGFMEGFTVKRVSFQIIFFSSVMIDSWRGIVDKGACHFNFGLAVQIYFRLPNLNFGLHFGYWQPATSSPVSTCRTKMAKSIPYYFMTKTA